MNHENAKELINNILHKYPQTRNNDTLLCFKVWRAQGLDVDNLEEQISNNILYNPETIIRHRAHIQNVEGLFLPTRAEVLLRRKIAERHIRRYYATNPNLINDWFELKHDIR